MQKEMRNFKLSILFEEKEWANMAKAYLFSQKEWGNLRNLRITQGFASDYGLQVKASHRFAITLETSRKASRLI